MADKNGSIQDRLEDIASKGMDFAEKRMKEGEAERDTSKLRETLHSLDPETREIADRFVAVLEDGLDIFVKEKEKAAEARPPVTPADVGMFLTTPMEHSPLCLEQRRLEIAEEIFIHSSAAAKRVSAREACERADEWLAHAKGEIERAVAAEKTWRENLRKKAAETVAAIKPMPAEPVTGGKTPERVAKELSQMPEAQHATVLAQYSEPEQWRIKTALDLMRSEQAARAAQAGKK